MDHKELEAKKVIELREYARKYKIPKYSRMRKDELIEHILKSNKDKSRKSSPKVKPLIERTPQKSRSNAKEFQLERTEAQTRLKIKEAYASSQSAQKTYSEPVLEEKPRLEHHVDKFATPELPYEYNRDRITMLIIDPTFVFIYWEVTNHKLKAAQDIAGWDSKLALRVYDVTDIEFDGHNAHSVVDADIYERIGCWYLKIDDPQRNLVVDIGLKNSAGQFHMISRSNFAKLPPLRMAKEGPIKWMAVDDLGNYVITEVEEYTEADLVLLKQILGEDLFARFMTGEFKGMLFSTIFKKAPDVKEISFEMPSSSFFKPTHRSIES